MSDGKGKRVDVTDVEKLRPELLTMSVAELERRRAEIDMAIERKAQIEEEEKRKIDIEIAGIAFEKMMDAIQELHGLGRLPDRIKNVLTSEDGTFQPGRYLKKPRS